MRVDPTRDRSIIEGFLRRDETVHVYPLADLDEPFWDDTRWLGAFEGDTLHALCLILDGLSMPIVSAVCPADDPPTRWLLEQIQGQLPARFFYNLGPGLTAALGAGTRIEPHGTWWKMHLVDPSLSAEVDDTGIVPLGPSDFEEITRFLAGDAYVDSERGGQFFDARMLESGCYRGIRENGSLVALGGVHVHSKRYGVAAVGNLVTRPDLRRRGFARRLSAAIVRSLAPEIPIIGLNVRADNEPAIGCYRGLGFRRVCVYDEGIATRA